MDASDPVYAALSKDISEARPFTIDVLYGDHEGGQHTITRFGIFPRGDGDVTKWYPCRLPALEPGPPRSTVTRGSAGVRGAGPGRLGAEAPQQ